MGTISEKLTYLNGTKQALKDSINALGGDITSETTFRNYVTELDNIYSNLPKTTGEGSNLSLTTLKGRINVDDILGDTEQEGTPTPSSPQDINVVTGTQEVVVQNKNYLRLNDIAETTTNGITYSCKNGVISFNGTATSGILIDFQTFNLPSGSYYINRNATGTISGSWQNYLRNSSSNIVQGQGTFTTTESQQVFFRVYFNSGVVCTNYVISPQIELGSSATDFIEHQEQTKTLHLGDIELAKIGTYQDRIFESSGKNLLDISKFEEHYTIGSNGLPAYNGGQTRITNTTPINVEGIGEVTLTCTLNGKSFIYSLLKADNTLISRVAGNPSGTTITIGEAKYLYICFYDNATLSNITDAMLNEGSTALPYEPYGSDKWYIEKNIGKVVLNGSENWRPDTTNQRYFLPSLISSNVLKPTNNNTLAQALSNIGVITANETVYTSGKNGVAIHTNGSIYVTKSVYDNISTTNVILYYVYGTTTYTEITNETLQNELNELEKMMSYNGTTNISVSGNLPMILDVSALKGE